VSYDAVILGAGPAGITTALELSRSGLSVALVESGGFEFDPDVQALCDGKVTGHDAVDLTAIRLRMFGGTSNHWGGHCVPLDPVDFARAPLSGMSGWPFGYDHLVPFYERAHKLCGLGPFDYSLGRVHRVGEEDFLLTDHPRLRTQAVIGSGPLNFVETFRDEIVASPRIDLRLHWNAVHFIFDESGQVTGVALRGLDGAEELISGRAVVIACGAVETARLLMVSNMRGGHRFGDAGGFLGRCYMDHLAGGAAFLALAVPVGAKAYWQNVVDREGREVKYVWRLSDEVLEAERLANAHFRLVPFSDDPAERKFAGEAQSSIDSLKAIAKWALGRDQENLKLSDAYCTFITNADSFVTQRWRTHVTGTGVRRLVLLYEAEQLPTRENFVALTKDKDAIGLPKVRLNWSPGLAERESIVRSAIEIGRICGEMSLGRIELEDHFGARYWDASTTWHQLGTARMAASSKDGVVDPNCRVHGARNLYVASGAVMPSVGRANPTLTIMALAIRLADHLKGVVRTL
jgi:choline dehydrogenase-like flavoprotein